MQTFHRITCFSSVCLIEQVIQAAKHVDAVQQLILCSYRQVIDGIRTFQVGLLLTTFVVVVQQGMAILDYLGTHTEVGLQFGLQLQQAFVAFRHVPAIIRTVHRKVYPVTVGIAHTLAV